MNGMRSARIRMEQAAPEECQVRCSADARKKNPKIPQIYVAMVLIERLRAADVS